MKLNLGAGGDPTRWMEGYANIDRSRKLWGHVEVYPLECWQNESCEEVRASHILEHFSHRETENVLKEWIRVLKPGGWLKVAVPDFKYIATEYLRGEVEEPLAGYCMGGQTDENDFHKAIFDEDGLRDAFQELGLVNVQKWESEIKDCASLPVSLNLMGQKRVPGGCSHCGSGDPKSVCITPADNVCRYGQKPDALKELSEKLKNGVYKREQAWETPVSIPKGEVIALMSLPRLSFTDNAFAVLQGVAGLGLRVIKSSGVFWGQCLTELIETAIRDGAKYVLTIDYDTLFKPDDVKRLYALMEENPKADAVMPLQMKRDSDSPLFTRNKELFQEEIYLERRDFDVDLYPAVTGHFGLTLLRCEAFTKLGKPWFRSQPDENGEWHANHKDEDIAFWHNWQESGNTLYLVPRVTIGHLQLLVTWPDDSLQARHQYLSEFHERGKPDWVWK